MSDAEDKKTPGPAAGGEGRDGEGLDPTDELARDRRAEPGPGARESTASQVDDPSSDTTPRPQTASPRPESEVQEGRPEAAEKAKPADDAEKGGPLRATEAAAKGAKPKEAAAKADTAEKDTAAKEAPAAEASAKADEAAKAAAAKAPAAGRAGAAARGAAAARAGAADRAGAGAARAGAAAKAAEEKPPEPSPKQPWLDGLVAKIRQRLGDDVVEEAAINRLSEDRPTLTVNRERWPELARFLKEEPDLAFVYLNDIVGVDYVTHFEVVYHLVSIAHREHLTVKVRTDREEATVPSVVSVWPGANWPEREAYDLLGIRFDGHPDLRRIMLPENWVGHPLRKDYEQYDEMM